MKRKPGKRLFKALHYGITYDFREVSPEVLARLAGEEGGTPSGLTVHRSDSFVVAEQGMEHTVYLSSDHGTERLLHLLHELFHVAIYHPQENNLERIFRTKSLERQHALEEAFISFVAPNFANLLRQIPRKYLK